MSDRGEAKVDLHMHSTASDGTDAPLQLLEKVSSLGLECFALTDHDTFAGVREILGRIPEGIRFIPGIEFSCRYHNKWQCHVLGYGMDLDDPLLVETVRKAHDMRLAKLMIRIERLKEDYNITFSEEELEALEQESCPGKPHLAELLVKKGYAAGFKEAFDGFLGKVHTGIYMEPETAVKAIRDSGGIPVWAHPFGEKEASFTEPAVVSDRVKKLKEMGLAGMECWYSQYYGHQIRFLKELAAHHDLLISGGSDYHGTRKKVAIGMLSREGGRPAPEELTILGALRK